MGPAPLLPAHPMTQIAAIQHISSVTWAIQPALVHLLSGLGTGSDIFSGCRGIKIGLFQAIEGIFSLGISMTEKIPLNHIPAMSLGHGGNSIIPLQFRTTDTAPPGINQADQFPDLGVH
jgi:hypothetical protein